MPGNTAVVNASNEDKSSKLFISRVALMGDSITSQHHENNNSNDTETSRMRGYFNVTHGLLNSRVEHVVDSE